MRKNDILTGNILFLKSVEKRLAMRRVPAARFEAEMLVRHFGSVNRIDFFTGKKALSSSAKNAVRRAVESRLKGVPLGYILKETEFCGHKFFISKDTLVPRPETELLVEETLRLLTPGVEILDIGTGSGCIAVSLTLAFPACRMTAVELSKKALKIARKNLGFHGLAGKIELLEGDLFGAFGREKEAFWDIIVSNPPYVSEEDFPGLSKEVLSEPRVALDGGPRGLKVIEAILREAPRFLKKGGWLLVEIGAGQSKPLREKILKGGIFRNLRFVKDYAEIDRILVVQK